MLHSHISSIHGRSWWGKGGVVQRGGRVQGGGKIDIKGNTRILSKKTDLLLSTNLNSMRQIERNSTYNCGFLKVCNSW
jgi:hypothetical protein